MTQGKKRSALLYAFSALTPALFGLSACNDSGALSELRGRYQGYFTLAGENKTQIISQIPNAYKEADLERLQFKVFETRALADGHAIEIQYQHKDQQFTVRLPKSLAPVKQEFKTQTTPEHGCTQGTEPAWIQLCHEPGKLDLVLLSEAGAKALEIHLTRDDSLPPIDGYERPAKEYTLDELLGRAKYLSYTVSQEAERVYQANHAVQVAQGNLLPSLNVKAIVSLITGDFLEFIGKVLPFLFPSNWYKWEAEKNLYQAEKLSFAALRGNEMNAVEGLAYSILRDQIVLSQLKRNISWMKKTQDGLLTEEKAGTMPSGSAEFFSASVALFERDLIGFERLNQLNFQELSQGVALSPLHGISSIKMIDTPDLERAQPIRGEDYFKSAQDRSYEIKTLQFLIEAAKNMTGEVIFGFMNADGSGALGFGTASSIKIGKSRERELRIRMDETYSIIEQRSGQVASEYNTALQNYKIATRGLKASQKKLQWLFTRHLTGDATLSEDDFLSNLVELHTQIITFIADQASSVASYMISKSKLDRLLLTGFYEHLEDGIPSEDLK